MQEMVKLAAEIEHAQTGRFALETPASWAIAVNRIDRVVQIVSAPWFGRVELLASPAQFGVSLESIEVLLASTLG